MYDPFLYRIVTGDRKWALYKNTKQQIEMIAKGETSAPHAKDVHPRKVLLSIWLDIKGLIL